MGIAIIDFVFLLFVVNFIPYPKPQTISKLDPTSKVLNGAHVASSAATPARNLFTELGSHNTRTSCWIGYRGHVYNITAVFGTHPGGDGVMLPYCGKDATTGFDTKGKTPAMPHSANAVSLLAQYLIQ